MQKIFGTACVLLALTIPTFMTNHQAIADELKENGCQNEGGANTIYTNILSTQWRK